MKHSVYSEYDSRQANLVESALLTVWPNLDPWFDDLVLVGGLVPRYICGDVAAPRVLPRPVTLDADLGIAVAASAGGMSSIQETLRDQGFRLTKNEGGVRYAKRVGDYTIPIDFLTDVPPNTHGTAMVDDIVANILPGINRALLTARNVTITGMDLTGVQQNLILRVCEVGPFLAMKLRAFASREQGKDAFDILYSLLHYDRGTEAAVSSFVEEVRADNAACPDALRCLELHFGSEKSLAPRKAADFFPGPVSSNDLSDVREQRLLIQQEMVNAANLLKAALRD
jgi:hypothetical protein